MKDEPKTTVVPESLTLSSHRDWSSWGSRSSRYAEMRNPASSLRNLFMADALAKSPATAASA